MRKFVTKFISDESGATAIEYGLIASLIAVVIIVGATTLGTNINQLFTDIAACLDGNAGTACRFGAAAPAGGGTGG